MKLRYATLCLVLISLASCGEKKSNPKDDVKETLFTLMPQDETGVTFVNAVENQKNFNIFKYRNFYNGGGVAIGLSTGTSSAGSMGISVGINRVTNDTKAFIANSNVTATGGVNVLSKTQGSSDEPTIDALVLAGAGGGSIGNGA